MPGGRILSGKSPWKNRGASEKSAKTKTPVSYTHLLYAIGQQDTLPKTMLFYNGGATLTCEDSPALEDLKSLEAQGVEIPVSYTHLAAPASKGRRLG